MDAPAELARSLGLAGVTVEFGSAARRISEPLLDFSWIDGTGGVTANRRCALIELFGGRYAIEEGERVTIEVAAGASAEMVEAELLSTVTAFLLAQRGIFALHANAVRGPTGAILISGVEGAGKSSTSVRLDQRGLALLSDDVSPLIPTGDEVLLKPTGRPVRLSRSTAAALDVDVAGARREVPDSDKLILHVPSASPERVAAVVALQTDSEIGGIRTTPLGGASALAALEAHVYRGELLHRIYRSDTFGWAAAVASVPVFQLVRPVSAWTIDAVADAVEQLASEG